MHRHPLLLLIIVWICGYSAWATTEKPNILLILADDLGWSDIGPYGGEIETPNLDTLASQGVRFLQFYNSARCCPSRASLLTGLYPHQTGMGEMVSKAPQERKPGPYQGYLNDSCVTLAEVLKKAGYRTLLSGKWHVGEFRPHWPVDRGFDHHYGLISGAMNYFDITKTKAPGIQRIFVMDDKELRPPQGETFYSTDAFTDHALAMLDDVPADQPFFLYLAYNAPHWPLQAPEEVTQKYEPVYQRGWDRIRQKRYQRLIELGLIPKETPFQHGRETPWDQLNEGEKKIMTRKMAVYAAMVDRMDWNIGRVLAYLQQSQRLENTFVVFLSDNGASSENGPLGINFRPDLTGEIGSADSYHSYGISGASISNTPLQRFKSYTHEGGIRTPCIIRWPQMAGVKAGTHLDWPGHILDFMPTFCELAGTEYPLEFKGRSIHPMEGQSLLPLLRGEAMRSRRLGWEHLGRAAWRDGNLKLVRPGPKATWELYDLATDPLELENLQAERPVEVQRLATAWNHWAERIGVYPRPR